jgi:hypothetical protein
VHIEFKGSATVLTAVLGSSVPLIVDAFTPTGAAVKDRQLRGIVATAKQIFGNPVSTVVGMSRIEATRF